MLGSKVGEWVRSDIAAKTGADNRQSLSLPGYNEVHILSLQTC